MEHSQKYRAHDVLREDRVDGSILLRAAGEMSAPVDKTTDWLEKWSNMTPDQVFLAERSGEGWQEVSYQSAAEQVGAIAAALLGLGLGKGTPILVLSGNSVRHGLLTLAAQMVGIPTVPIAEQYSLIPSAHGQLDYFVGLTRPALVYAEDQARFSAALAHPAFDDLLKVVGKGGGPGFLSFGDLLAGDKGVDLVASASDVGPDAVVKILTTSGSTSAPKGVATTHRMMCANQAQVADALPFLGMRPPVLMDWLPWNHVFGGSHNFNLALANGGSLYIDFGKPVQALVGTTIENIRLKSATIAFNVPVGFGFLRDAMKADKKLREAYFRDLDMLFYAGASLPQDIWSDLEDMAREIRGDLPMFTSSWGLTETAPAVLLQHEPTDRSGVVGVPVSGTTIKLVPDDEGRVEVRVKGPQIFKGYLDDPKKSAEAFDDEGFFVSGDMMAFVDPEDMNKGLRFLGRISEDFKLTSGTWVRSALLRLELLKELSPFVADLVVCGEGRSEIGLLLFLSPEGQAIAGQGTGGVFHDAALFEALSARLNARKSAGSAARIARVIVAAAPPDIATGEVTAKGNLNFRKLLKTREDLVARLFDASDPHVLKL